MPRADDGGDPHHWTAAQVAGYLRSVNLPDKYVDVFLKEDVNGMVLLNLTKEELKDDPFEIKGFGPIKTVLGAIQKLKDDAAERKAQQASAKPAPPPAAPPAKNAVGTRTPEARRSPQRRGSDDHPPLLIPQQQQQVPPPLDAAARPPGASWLLGFAPPPAPGMNHPPPATVGTVFPQMPPPPVNLMKAAAEGTAAPPVDMLLDPMLWQPPVDPVAPADFGGLEDASARGFLLPHLAGHVPLPLTDLLGVGGTALGDPFLPALDSTSPMSSSPQMPVLITTPQEGTPDRDPLHVPDMGMESPVRCEAVYDDDDEALVTELPDATREDEEEVLPLTDTSNAAMVFAHNKKWVQVLPTKEFHIGDWTEGSGKKKVVGDALHSELLTSGGPLPKFMEIPETDLNDPPSNWMDDDRRVNPKYNPGTISYPSQEFKVGGLSIAALDHAHAVAGSSQGASQPSPKAADFIAPADTLKKLFTVPYSNSDLCFSIHRVGPSLMIEAGNNQSDTNQDLMLSKLLYYSILTEDHQMKKTQGPSGAPSEAGGDDAAVGASRRTSGAPAPQRPASQLCTPETEPHPAPVAPADTVQLDEWHLLGDNDSTVSTPLNSWGKHVSPGFLEKVNQLDSSLAGASGRVDITPKKKYPPAPPTFYRNLKWHFKDLEIVLGSDQLVMQQDQGREVAVKLRSLDQPLGPSDALEMWLDNVMNNVPEVAICYHKDGVTQGYQLVNTADLPSFQGDASFEPQVVQEYAGNVLHWLKDNCTRDAGSYILVREGSTTLKLYDLSAMCGDVDEEVDAGVANIRSHTAEPALLGPPSQSKALVASKKQQGPSRRKGPLPFAYPVGMLCFRMGSKLSESGVAENLKKAISLLHKALLLLPAETQPVILVEARLHLANAYARYATSPESECATTSLESAAKQLEAGLEIVSKAEDLTEEAACRDRLIHCYLHLAEAQVPTADGVRRSLQWIRSAERVVADSELLAYRPLRGALTSTAETSVDVAPRWLYRAATRVHEALLDFHRNLASTMLAMNERGNTNGGTALVASLNEELETHARGMPDLRHSAMQTAGLPLTADPEANIDAAVRAGGHALDRKRRELDGMVPFHDDPDSDAAGENIAAPSAHPLVTHRSPAELLRRVGETYVLFGVGLWRGVVDAPAAHASHVDALSHSFSSVSPLQRSGSGGGEEAAARLEDAPAEAGATATRMDAASRWLHRGLSQFGDAEAAAASPQEAEIMTMCKAACLSNLAELSLARAARAAPTPRSASFTPEEQVHYDSAAAHVAAAEAMYRELQAANPPSAPATPISAPSTPVAAAQAPTPVSVVASLLSGCVSLKATVCLLRAVRQREAFVWLSQNSAGVDLEEETSDLLFTALRLFSEVRAGAGGARASFELGELLHLTLDLNYVPPGGRGGVSQDSRFRASERHYLRAEEAYEASGDDSRYLGVRCAITRLHLWQYDTHHTTQEYLTTVMRTFTKSQLWLAAHADRIARGGARVRTKLAALARVMADVLEKAVALRKGKAGRPLEGDITALLDAARVAADGDGSAKELCAAVADLLARSKALFL